MYLKKNKVGRTFERAWREEREGQRCDYTIILKIKTNKKTCERNRTGHYYPYAERNFSDPTLWGDF